MTTRVSVLDWVLYYLLTRASPLHLADTEDPSLRAQHAETNTVERMCGAREDGVRSETRTTRVCLGVVHAQGFYHVAEMRFTRPDLFHVSVWVNESSSVYFFALVGRWSLLFLCSSVPLPSAFCLLLSASPLPLCLSSSTPLLLAPRRFPPLSDFSPECWTLIVISESFCTTT